MRAGAEIPAAAGRWAEAFEALARQAGLRAPAPDFKLRARDPRQDMQYGESLMLCANAAPYRRARAALGKIRARLPRSAEAWLLSGVVETILGRFSSGEELFERALELDKQSAWARAWRGVCRALECRRRKTHEGLRDALADLDAAAQDGRAARFVYPWRAELRHDLEDLNGALADLFLILRADPSNLWARVERGEILCELGKHGEALHEFDRLARENPKAAWAHALRGRTLATTGREAESLADLERAVALDKRSGAARAWLAESLRKLGRYAQALKQLDAAVRLEPKFVLAWVWRGRLHLLAGRYAPAVRDLDRAIKLDPRYQLAFAWRGEALHKLGKKAAAQKDFARVKPLDLRRTWNPVLSEGEKLTPEARVRAYEASLA